MGWADYVIGTGKAAGFGVIVLVIIVIVALISWWIYRVLSYNKKVVVREVTGSRNLVYIDWAKEYKSKKSGAFYWKLKSRKHIIPKPPPKALDVTKGGKLWAELFYTGQGQYIPAVVKDTEFSSDKEFIETFQPITESQRASYVDQIEKSYSYKQKGLSDILRDAVPYIALVMIIAVFLLFLGEGMTPILEQAQIAQASTDDFVEATGIMRDAILQTRGIQVIGGNPQKGNVSSPPD